MNPVADVLHSLGEITGDELSRVLVIETKCGNAGILAMKNSRLAVRRRRRQSAKPSAKIEVLFVQQLLYRRTVSACQRSSQVGICERVDLEHDETTLAVMLTLLFFEEA